MIEIVTFRMTSGLHGNVTTETLTIVLKKVYQYWPAGATCKLLFIKHLTKIRVVVFATLKMLNMLTHSRLRGAHIFNCRSRQSCR